MSAERQSSALPPAQPSYVFRGHQSAIHSVQVVRQNSRLVTGDADGWIVFWKLESKRPVAVWKAHDAAILGTGEWLDRFITHGRDNALRIWQLRSTDESLLSDALPTEDPAMHRPKPWLLHSLPVNTLNFCSFSMYFERRAYSSRVKLEHASLAGLHDSILVAVPARDDKKVEVYRFPDESLVHVVPRVQLTDTGMVMAVKLAYHRPSNNMLLIAGYEGGYTAVHLLANRQYGSHGIAEPAELLAQTIYLSQPHTQPVLSLDALPDAKTYFTSSADAVIAAHRIPELPLNIDDKGYPALAEDGGTSSTELPVDKVSAQRPDEPDEELLQTRVTQALDGPEQPTSSLLDAKSSDTNTVPQLATQSQPTAQTDPTPEPLVFSKRPIPLAIERSSSATIPEHPASPSPSSSSTNTKPSGLSTLLSNTPTDQKVKPEPPSTPQLTIQPPYKSAQTKHAGQQSLHVRSDGRLLVTGGWDSRVRIYSTKTLKEMAVLKWHKDGVYATAFSEILDPLASKGSTTTASSGVGEPGNGDVASQAKGNLTGLGKLQKQRELKMQTRHWVAAGAKDGKVSLWEVF